MAIALEIRVGDLFPEFPADALIVLRPLQPTGAVASRALQTFPDGFYQFLIVVEPNRHSPTLPFTGIIVRKGQLVNTDQTVFAGEQHSRNTP